MTIKKTFLPPEYWYVKKDTSNVHWTTFEKWFREKGGIRDDYNNYYDYFTYDFDGYTILPNPPKKTAKYITLEQWIHWYSLQEKTEKPLSQKRAEAIERGKEMYDQLLTKRLEDACGLNYTKDPYILEKLRSELERRKTEQEEESKNDKYDDEISYSYGVISTCKEILALLTSLETSEALEPLNNDWAKEAGKDFAKNMGQFTPGQEIEVSNDGEKWEKAEFHHYDKIIEAYICLSDNTCYWKFARPIADKIELVPEYEEVKQGRHIITGDRKDRQIAIITEKLNEVIKKINT